MARFVPRRVCQTHHFALGHGIAPAGLVGLTFLDTFHFVLFETGRDRSYVHEVRTLRHRGHQ